jgi:hypothetical protein
LILANAVSCPGLPAWGQRMQFNQVGRREFITLLGGAAATWPLAARAQQRAMPTVGLLFLGTPETNGDELTGLRRGMSETASTNREIDAAFARAIEQRVDALVIARSQLFTERRVQLTTLSVRHLLPAMFYDRKFTEVGGLMSYSPNTTDQFRQVGIYVGRILKGDKLADLPVMQPTKFELVINAQTARLLGVELSPTLLARADEVIE